MPMPFASSMPTFAAHFAAKAAIERSENAFYHGQPQACF